MINGENRWYMNGNHCTCHSIGTSGHNEIVVVLDTRYIINHIRMALFDLGKVSYNYCIQVSLDRKTWKNIIDYSQFLCRSWQHLFFPPEPVKYIRIVGNRSINIGDGTQRDEFNVLYFECLYSTASVCIEANFIVPKSNVCGSANPYQMTERHFLEINDYAKKMLPDGTIVKSRSIPFARGSIWWITSNCINFQLAQPFIVDCISFFVHKLNPNWHEMRFSYYVEISNDFENWKIIQRQKEILVSEEKEVIRFAAQPVVFIRIGSPHLLHFTVKCFECHANSINSSSNKKRAQSQIYN